MIQIKVVKSYITKNRCYFKPVKLNVKKLVLHSPGVAQPNPANMIKSMNSPLASKAVHAFITENEIFQTLPWQYRGWHVGKGRNGSYNSYAIGVELCEPKGHKYKGGTMIGYDAKKNVEYFEKVYHNAVVLFAKLCEVYKLDPVKDILCHSEVFALGYGSNHSDVMQWFPKHGKNMDTFRRDVKAYMEE